MSEENKNAYLQALKNALSDGTIDNDEWQMLETLRKTLSISLEEHYEMESKIRVGNPKLARENNEATIKDSVINRSTVTNIGKVEIKDKKGLKSILEETSNLFENSEEMDKAINRLPIKDEIKDVLNLIDGKINHERKTGNWKDDESFEERQKGAKWQDFNDVIEICEKKLQKKNNPYLWAIKGYCRAMLGDYDLGIELLIKSFQVAYNEKEEKRNYKKFRQFLFDTRNLSLCINGENKYLISHENIATLGRTGYEFRSSISDIELEEEIDPEWEKEKMEEEKKEIVCEDCEHFFDKKDIVSDMKEAKQFNPHHQYYSLRFISTLAKKEEEYDYSTDDETIDEFLNTSIYMEKYGHHTEFCPDCGSFTLIENSKKLRDKLDKDAILYSQKYRKRSYLENFYNHDYRYKTGESYTERKSLEELSDNIPQYTFIPKIKNNKLENKGNVRTARNSMASKAYLPIQQFLQENNINQKEAVEIFTEFKELYSIYEDNNIQKHQALLENYSHEENKSGATFLCFLKTICDQIIKVLDSKMSDVEVDTSLKEKTKRAVFDAQREIYNKQIKRNREIIESKPGFWESYLSDGEADRKWEDKSYSSDWDSYIEDSAIKTTENWDEMLENLVENNAERIIAYKHKIAEIKMLRNSLIVFNKIPLNLDTDKMRVFITNYEVMKRNLSVYEKIKHLDECFTQKSYICLVNEYGDRASDELKKTIPKTKRKQYLDKKQKILSEYFYTQYDSDEYDPEIDKLMRENGFALHNYEGKYNSKKINTKLFTASQFRDLSKIKFKEGKIIKINPEETNMSINFSWIKNGMIYPGTNYEDTREFIKLNKKYLN